VRSELTQAAISVDFRKFTRLSRWLLCASVSLYEASALKIKGPLARRIHAFFRMRRLLLFVRCEGEYSLRGLGEFSRHFQGNEYVPCYKRTMARKREAIGALAAGLLSCESAAPQLKFGRASPDDGDAFRRGLK
jgi:hypothetical protein